VDAFDRNHWRDSPEYTFVIPNNSKRIKNQSGDLEESRNAGRNKFDEIGKSLGFRELNWMSTLRRREYTWDTFIHSHTALPMYASLEYWEKATEGYDRDAFAAGFFERSRESWCFETEEYRSPATRNRSIYYALPEIVPFFMEVDLICHHWATYQHRRNWSICLGQNGGDFELHRLAEWRLKQLRELVGSDRVAAITAAVEESQAEATPTLWQIYRDGTRLERQTAQRIAEQIGDDEMAIEATVKKALEFVPNQEELVALAEHYVDQEYQNKWNAFFGDEVNSDWDFVNDRQTKIIGLIGEDAFDEVVARVHDLRTKGRSEVWRVIEECDENEEELLLRIYHEERAKHDAGKCDCKGAHVFDLEALLKAALDDALVARSASHQVPAAKPEVEKHGKK
jgi:hypothetical protein